MMRPFMFLVVAVLLAFAQSATAQGYADLLRKATQKGAPEEQQSRSMADWTIMIYMAADNNLDSFAMNDLEELEQIGSSPEIQIIVLLDRSADGQWSEARMGRIKYAPEPGVQSFEDPACFINVGEIDMGDPETLYEFVLEADKFCQEMNLALIIWNHGGGWRSANPIQPASRDLNAGPRGLPWVPTPGTRSIASDDESGGELMMSEVRGALEDALYEEFDDGITSLDLLAFDACLMGSIEVAYEMSGVASRVLASEQLVPGEGFDYAASFAPLKANPKMSGDELAISILKAYDARYKDHEDDATLCFVDTYKLKGYIGALNNLVYEIGQNNATAAAGGSAGEYLFAQLKQSRAAGEPEMGDDGMYGRFPYVDLGQFLKGVADNADLPESVRAAGATALQYHKAAVPGYMFSQTRTRSGLSIFFPKDKEFDEAGSNPNFMTSEYTGENILFAKHCLWPKFIKAYAYNEPMPALDRPEPVPAISAPSAQPSGENQPQEVDLSSPEALFKN